MFILISILTSPHTPHSMLGPPADGPAGEHGVGGGWGDIDIFIDINVSIDIQIIVNMTIEDSIDYYTLWMSIFKHKSKIPQKL